MDPNTGHLYEFENDKAREQVEKQLGRKLVPLTKEQVKKLKLLSKRRRKALLGGMSCPCGSGKSFKKCCWKKYKNKK